MIALTPARLIDVDELDDRRLQRTADALELGDDRLVTDRHRYRYQAPDGSPIGARARCMWTTFP